MSALYYVTDSPLGKLLVSRRVSISRSHVLGAVQAGHSWSVTGNMAAVLCEEMELRLRLPVTSLYTPSEGGGAT